MTLGEPDASARTLVALLSLRVALTSVEIAWLLSRPRVYDLAR